MYIPRHFAHDVPEDLTELIADYPLATLILSGPEQPLVNHIPLLFAPEDGPNGALHGHVARANPLWGVLPTDAVAVFHGPSAYVSPSWYPSKARDHRVVPTWNYAVVHAEGTATCIEDRQWLRAQIERLTDAQQTRLNDPWRVGDAPAAFLEKMIDQVVGVRIELTALRGKWKVSQNRSAEDRSGVVQGLRNTASPPENHAAAALIPAESGPKQP